MTQAEKTLMSALMYMRVRYVGYSDRKIYNKDPGDSYAIRVLENFYILAQILEW